MFPKISVIVPIYKVEAYLCQCVDSILAQTYTNLEVILVDDGSPDTCGIICDEYAKRDDRIVVIHKENGGLSDARNKGIEIATCEYLTFIDSDDWIKADMIEMLYDNLVNYNADISCCGYYKSYVNLNEYLYDTSEILILNSEQAIEHILLNSIGKVAVMAWGKLYKKYIFNEIRYPFGRIHEDEFVIVHVLESANIIVIDTTPGYYYRQRKSSIIKGFKNNVYSPKRMDLVEALELRLKKIEDKYINMYNKAKARLLNVNLKVLSSMLRAKKYKELPGYEKVMSTLLNNYKFIIGSDFFTRNDKIKITAIKINVNLYKLLRLVNYWLKKKTKDKNLFD